MCLSSIFSFNKQTRASYWFLLIGVVWMLPLIIVVLFFEVALWRTGETMTLRFVAEQQAERGSRKVLMRRYFDQGLYRLKYLCIQLNKPEILILGTSRVMQIRREMFGVDRTDVYNAGGMIQHLRDLEEYVNCLSKADCPRAVIIGLEPWWFNEKWSGPAEKEKNFLSWRVKDDGLDGVAHAAVFQLFFRSLLMGRCENQICKDVIAVWRREINPAKDFLGFAALEENAGFRPDGSMDFGRRAIPSDDWTFVDREEFPVVKRILERRQGFESVTNLNPVSIARLRKSLGKLRAMGVAVTCFVPPFPSEVLAAIEQSKDLRYFWRDYLTIIPAIVSEEGGNCVDVSRPEMVGMDDRCMRDGLHAMETFHVALLRKIIEKPEWMALLKIDRTRIDRILSDEASNFWFPEYR